MMMTGAASVFYLTERLMSHKFNSHIITKWEEGSGACIGGACDFG